MVFVKGGFSTLETLLPDTHTLTLVQLRVIRYPILLCVNLNVQVYH